MKIVYTTDVSYYMQWQSELLEFSWQQCGRTGDLVRLVATREDDPAPRHGLTEVYCCPYSASGLNDSVPLVANRLFLLENWMQTQGDDVPFVFMDPDIVFRRPLELVRGENPIGQHWIGVLDDQSNPWGMFARFIKRHSRVSLAKVQALTWPSMVTPGELRQILPRWSELHLQINQEFHEAFRAHVPGADMLGYTIAAAEAGVHHDLEMIAAFTKWPEERVKNAPAVHYCQDVELESGEVFWSKKSFKPWHSLPVSGDLKFAYYRDLIDIVRGYQQSHRDRVLHSRVSVKQGLGWDESADGVMLETLGGERIRLDQTGVFVLENSHGKRVKQFIAEVAAQYPESAGEVEDDIYTCIAEFESRQIVELHDELG